MPFDGETYERAKDRRRLLSQLGQVRLLMLSGAWFTLEDLEQQLGYPQASISARLRDLRKEKFGKFNIERRRVPDADGLHEYRLVQPKGQLKLL